MLPKIQELLHKECQLSPDQPVLAGVSGGPDSMCLLEVLLQAGYEVVAAHYDHQLRPESQAEAEVLAARCADRGIRFVKDSGDVRALAKLEGLSLEEAARRLRYKFLFSGARKHGAQAVAVGHTADDQVETVLMHLLRGAGLTGLKGMGYRTVLPEFDPQLPLVRPLLGTWRTEVERFCQLNNLEPFQDASNQSHEFLRNRVRHVLLPQLEEYNPRIRAALWRSSRTLADDYAILGEALASAWETCLLSEEQDRITFKGLALTACSQGHQRHLLRRALEQLARETVDIRFDVLERGVAFLAMQRDGRVDLTGGVRLEREGEKVILAKGEAKALLDAWPQMTSPLVELPVPGQLELSNGWRLSCEMLPIDALDLNQALHCEDPFQAWLDADGLTGELVLRTRRPGDRFQPLGMGGRSMKVSDFFINEKLAHPAREGWPLLCAGETIAWIPGYRPAHPFRLKSATRVALMLTFTKETEK